MRKLYYLLTVAVIFSACNEFSTSEIKIEATDFTNAITDSVLLDVESTGDQLEIKGDLNLTEGECILSLKAPTGNFILSIDTIFVPDTLSSNGTIIYTDTLFNIDSLPEYKLIYEESFIAPIKTSIDEKFDRTLGRWTFNYQMKKLNDVNPQGSFDFVLKYKN